MKILRMIADVETGGGFGGLASVTYNERHISVVRIAFSRLGYIPDTILRDGATYSVSSGLVTFHTWRDKQGVYEPRDVHQVPLTAFDKYTIPDVLRWVEVVE